MPAPPFSLQHVVPAFVLGVVVGLSFALFIPAKAPERAPEYSRTVVVEASDTPPTPASASKPVAKPVPASLPAAAAPAPRPMKPRPKPTKPAEPTPQERVAKHWEESIDGDWAEQANETMRKDLEALETKDRFNVESVDCRKTSCVAVLEWASDADPERATQDLLAGAYTLECQKILFRPGRIDGGLQAMFFFHACTR
ncbi:MAG: hypothetical protein IT381_02640 [Deltaproteobacteria bacterium]|nr:hypothetical protein [Deltaproteobacteria bacterium]